jgi:3-phenylpropionate/trans-cinnamate dioxygenase ferredoxin reductase subunit
VFDDPHWFWSDQFGLNLQYAGHAEKWDEVVVRGSVEDLDFIAFYLDGGVVRAAFSVERGGDMYMAKELIAAQATPDPARLRDEDQELAELLAS